MSNKPKKVDPDFFKRIEEGSKFVRETQKEADFKRKLRNRGLFPIVKDGVLYIYSVEATDETKKIVVECRENLFDVYKVVTNDRKFIGDFLYRSSLFSEFRNVLDYHSSTKEELFRHYNLDDEDARTKFLVLPQNKSFKFDGNMTFDEIVEGMAEHYMTFNFKRPSKICEVIVSLSRYFDADYAASKAYRVLYTKDHEFARGTNPIEEDQMRIDRMVYSNKEDKLSHDEKLSLIKRTFDSFDIKCLYSSKIDEISDFILKNIFKTNDKKLIYGFAEHNYDLLYKSEFSDIYKNMSSTNDFESDIKKHLKKM